MLGLLFWASKIILALIIVGAGPLIDTPFDKLFTRHNCMQAFPINLASCIGKV